MDEKARVYRRRARVYLLILGTVALANLVLPGQRHLGVPLFFGLLHFGLGCAAARHGRSRREPAARKRSDQGRWLDAPIAEVDKSTCGLLLANRWRRDPSLRVIASRGGRDTSTGPHGGLWDRELDG